MVPHVRKKFLNETKNHNPTPPLFKLNGRSLRGGAMLFFLKKVLFPDFEEKNNLSFKGKEMVLFVYVVFNIDSNVNSRKKIC